MNIKAIEAVLEHYGVKGQKWGVRKKRGRSAESKSVAGLRKKTARQLSNKQLKKVNERLALETQYKSINKSRASKGKSVVGNILAGAGKTIVTSLLVSVGTKYAKQVLTTALKKGG